MPDAGVTTTGLAEMRTAVDTLAQREKAALQDTAVQTGRRIAARAQRLLRQQTHGTGQTAAEIHLVTDAHGCQVISDAPADRPADLPTYLEFGTVKMGARPYMRPALDAEATPYQRDSERASFTTVQEVLK